MARPDLGPEDIAAVTRVLETPFLSLGPAVPRFELELATYVGAAHAVAVSSGTAGLHLAVLASGLSEGDEVLTTPFSFVASANCLLYERVRPVFVDIHPETWDLRPEAIEPALSSRTRGILLVHLFGRPSGLPEIPELASRRGLILIEDACEALGTTVGGRAAGTFGRAGVFAFYPNKQITTGEGGAIVTQDSDLARLCRSLRNQGRAESGAWLEHQRLGYNYRMSDINAALGSSQLTRIETFIRQRQHVFDLYAQALEDVPEVIPPPPPPPGTRVSWFVYVVRLRDEFTHEQRDRVLQELRKRGIGCRNYFAPIHLQPYMRDRFGFREGQFPVTEAVAARTIALPFFNRLTENQVARVVEALREAIASLGSSSR